MTLDFQQICRVCLQSAGPTFDIFSSYCVRNSIVYADMMSSCTKIRPLLDDGLPRLMCKECLELLKQSYSFNVQCEESDQILRACLVNRAPTPKLEVQDTNYMLFSKEEVGEKNILAENAKGQIVDITEDVIIKGDIIDEIKTEPMDNGVEDDCWSADDDNVKLADVKKEKKENTDVDTPTTVVKKKRGRKKKLYSDGVQLSLSKRPHQCDVCGKVLSTRSNLKAHKICHTDQRPYHCSDCDATFRGYSALYQHRKSHSGLTPYRCEFCDKPFKRRTGLVNHVKIHTGDKPHSCDICSKTFTQSAQLYIHMKRHKGEKSFLCQDCGKGFPIRSDLTVHQRTHNGEKPFSCHLCNKTFATSGNLSIHVRIHKKEIRYHCKVCSKGFVTCSSFNVHVKRHKGQRDYQCECGKTFYTSSSLKQHRVVHTGEKKYMCKLCEKRFSQTSHLSRHFKKDHCKPSMPVPSSDFYKVVLTQGQMYKAEVEGADLMQKCEVATTDVMMLVNKNVVLERKKTLAKVRF